MLQHALVRMAGDLGVVPEGDAVSGWHDRSIGTLVSRGEERFWLRLAWARPEWARGMWWTGNADSSVLVGIPKPAVIEVAEQVQGPVVVRAELMSLVGGSPAAPESVLRAEAAVDEEWWLGLQTGLAALASTPTTRRALDPDGVRRRIAVFFGVDLDVDQGRWVASHGDLHWNNLHTGPLGILDWEAWGLAPRGYDAAFLLCHSLAVPAVAAEISRRFHDDLGTEDGLVAQLHVLTRLLTRADGGENPDLVEPLHRHADSLLGRIRTRRTHPSHQGENA
ncbi:MAG: phosphotransferase [Microbacterium sp.]|nr:phosphotransferase [Microbacterium sp.]